MKKLLIISFLLFCFASFSQKKVVKKIQIKNQEVNIFTNGLDNIVLENSDSNFVEICLFTEEYDDQLIEIDQKTDEINISFKFEGTQSREVIFRKFITKRLQRANVIVKIPKAKTISVFGENVDVISKSIDNNLSIYIDNGIVKLNKIKADTILKLYSGNVYALVENTNVKVDSNIGKIKIGTLLLDNKSYEKTESKNLKKLSITSIKGNIFLEH